ncbi:MAG: chromosome partitioning protein ParB [Leptospiraceae bacterium]|nr:MAG: chromosome partitioning protein ParB [Leptospiraceae bacterium]
MATKRKGLGKGLANLLPDLNTTNTESSSNEFQYIDVDKIEPNPDQPRKRFNQKELEELAETIKNVGILEPIIVRQENEKYIIISGERRWRATKLAGFKKIPAILKNVDDIKSAELAIIENIQREDLTPLEEARAYERLMKLTNMNIKQIAERVGKDRSTISNLLRLLKLPEEIQQLVEDKKITAGQVRPLLSIADKKMMIQLANKIVEENWSARKVEEEVAKITDPVSSKTTTKNEQFKDPAIIDVEKKIRAKFTTKVDIQHKSNGSGKIIIHYANLDEFDRIIELLGIEL